MSEPKGSLSRRRFLRTSVGSLAGLLASTGSVSAAWCGLSEWNRRHARTYLPTRVSGHRVVDFVEEGGQYRPYIRFIAENLRKQYGRESVRWGGGNPVEQRQLVELADLLGRSHAGPEDATDIARQLGRGENVQIHRPDTALIGQIEEHLRAERLYRRYADMPYDLPICHYKIDEDEDLAEPVGPINAAWEREVVTDHLPPHEENNLAVQVQKFMSSVDRKQGRWPGESALTEAFRQFIARINSRLDFVETGPRYILTGEVPDDCSVESLNPSPDLEENERVQSHDAHVAKPDPKAPNILFDISTPRQYHARLYEIGESMSDRFGVIGQVHHDRIDHGKTPFISNSWRFGDSRQELQNDWKNYNLNTVDVVDITIYEECVPNPDQDLENVPYPDEFCDQHEFDGRLAIIQTGIGFG